jgi:hypothetical protein
MDAMRYAENKKTSGKPPIPQLNPLPIRQFRHINLQQTPFSIAVE